MNSVAEEPCTGGWDPKKWQRDHRNCLSDQRKSIHDLIRGKYCLLNLRTWKQCRSVTVTLFFYVRFLTRPNSSLLHWSHTQVFFVFFSPDYSKWTPNEWCHFLPWPHPSLDNSLSRCWMSLRLGCQLSTQPWQEELYANRPRWRRTGHFSRSFSGKRSPLNPIVLLWTANNSKQCIGEQWCHI